jgi:hypothetical protein
MKIPVMLVLLTISAHAKDCFSPNHQFAVRAEEKITLVDLSSGNQILVIDNDTRGLIRVEVAWSPDSKHVAIAEDAQRGSSILAAWQDGSVWHKTLERDADAKQLIEKAESMFKGRLVAENRIFDGWLSDGSLRVKGTMHFSSGRKCDYEYTLCFLPNAEVTLDRGGYEEGELVGKDYHVL